ncbi:MAG TPA: phosphate ABC transporter substrate-binding protein PstS [Xanthobacteraceae bacterium]|jgi:phosphate transport system substrate-binding protein|nr:phosphate ABC transporter substrate-binding protein PstS [Xanthobacteraceae bacterium]
MRKHLAAAVAAATVTFVVSAHAASLTGAGGTAIYPVLSKWADTYAKETGDTVNYQAIGSGGGIKQIESKTVLFANTDMPLKPDDVAKNGLVQFPQVIISITPVVHLAGIKPGELVFDGPTLAQVYLGNIKEWDDPAIKKLNPNVNLPHQAITTVHRSDGSGTTFNFTDYLSKVSPDWKSKVGEGTAVNWPNGVGGKGNPGVASYVQQVDGAIGYVEYAYVIENHMVYTDMVNQAGKTITPTMDAFQDAAANADFTKVQDFYLILTDQPGDKSWPITAATYMLLRKDSPPDQNHLALKFLDWALKKGQDQAKALDYVPLPDAVVQQIEGHWSKEIPDAWKTASN